jgi:hypothetical protein
MSDGTQSNLERWEELQIARLLFGLSPEELVEYESLAQTMPAETGEEFERLIATIDVAWSDSKPLPAHLRELIRAKAVSEITQARQQQASPAGASIPGPRRVSVLPWFIAAASLLVSFITITATRNPNVAPAPAQIQDLAQLRSALITSADDLVQLSWTDGPTPIEGAGGDIVWSDKLQQGYMRFKGMPVNDPKVRQYQLWIFDTNQSEKTPVDGGVFDITSTEDIIVPIHSKLQITKAYLFAVTVEKSGGVVVSSRENLPLLAAVK